MKARRNSLGSLASRALVPALAALALSGLAPITAWADPAVVKAPAGALRGVDQDGLRVFKGVPYAAGPVGALRWKPPVAAPAWSGVRDALDFGPVCYQPKPRAGGIYSSTLKTMSEDCLSLNVWAPDAAKKAPVLVWIHGGSADRRRRAASRCTTARPWPSRASWSCRSTTASASWATWLTPS